MTLLAGRSLPRRTPHRPLTYAMLGVMALTGLVTEALLLGVASGPVCLASCSPVLVPVLAAEQKSPRDTGALLAQFLGGRLAGYLGFACLAWLLGLSLELQPRGRALVYGLADLGLAIFLGWYALIMRAQPAADCEQPCPAARARLFAQQYRSFAPVILGFVSGLTLCPPFVAAGVRAAESGGLAHALLFFLWFFFGTSIWFAPSVGLGMLRRFAAVGTVARLTLFLLAGYYGYVALVILERVLSDA
jgi:sulfite exporter TauE/SafE